MARTMKKNLLMMAALVGTSFIAQAEELKLDEVMAEYVEARGGMDALNAIKTMKSTGKMTMGPMEAPMQLVYQAPNKIHTSFEIQGMKGIQAYDGETGWQVMPFMGKTEPEQVSGDELKQLKEQTDMEGVLINAEEKGTKLELIGKTEIEGTPVIEIKATKENGDVTTVYLDEEYKLEVMTRSKMKAMGQEIEAETYMSDYKEVGENNIPVPHAMAVKVNGTVAQNLTLETVEFNVPVEEGFFTMPEVAEKKVAEKEAAAEKSE